MAAIGQVLLILLDSCGFKEHNFMVREFSVEPVFFYLSLWEKTQKVKEVSTADFQLCRTPEAPNSQSTICLSHTHRGWMCTVAPHWPLMVRQGTDVIWSFVLWPKNHIILSPPKTSLSNPTIKKHCINIPGNDSIKTNCSKLLTRQDRIFWFRNPVSLNGNRARHQQWQG